MKIEKFLNTQAGQIVTLAIVAGIGVYYVEKKARQVAGAIDPTNNDNVFASGVDSVGASLTGNDNFKLGVWIYDAIHGTTAEQLERQRAIDANPLASFWQGYAKQ